MKIEKDPGKFLSPEDVDDQELVEIANEGEEVESKFGNRLQIGVNLETGGMKTVTLNPTSKNALIDAYGDDTKTWIGKEMKAHKTKSKIGKEVKTVLYFTHPNKDLEGNDINA